MDTTSTVVDRIIKAHVELAAFWSRPGGWAPEVVSEILERCRLDRQTELARCLRLWVEEGPQVEAQGRLMLARANLGALVEGAMQLGLTVLHTDYVRSTQAVRDHRNKEVLVEVPEIMLNRLQIFFRDKFWLPKQRDRWDPWVNSVRQRRNCVHAFAEREIGTHAEFLADVRMYLAFLAEINDRLPYP